MWLLSIVCMSKWFCALPEDWHRKNVYSSREQCLSTGNDIMHFVGLDPNKFVVICKPEEK